jgi:hypothetical protein
MLPTQNHYCNVTNFDWTKPAMLDLWQQAVANATAAGGVDGVFADHLNNNIGDQTTADGVPQLCNGSGALRACWNFTAAFAATFNAAHAWLGNKTQDLLSRLPGKGPVVDGPYASWSAAFPACKYEPLRAAVLAGRAGAGPFVLEANHGDVCDPDDSCLANFLAAAEEFTYLACFADAPVASTGNQFSYPLGPPTGPPVEGADGVVRRSFRGPAGLTNVSVVLKTGVGRVELAAAPPAPPPPPAQCGALPPDTAVATSDIGMTPGVAGPADCCALCAANAKCAIWCWHGEQGAHHQECHLHTNAGVIHPLAGAISGRMNRTSRSPDAVF